MRVRLTDSHACAIGRPWCAGLYPHMTVAGTRVGAERLVARYKLK